MDDTADRTTSASSSADVPAPANPGKGPGKLQKILVGGVVALVALSILYGPQSAFQMLALSVVCTFGLGLIPILFVFWLVGEIVISVIGSIRESRSAQPAG